MKKSEFLVLVQNELDTIKAKATKEEIEQLSMSRFDYSKPEKCIYGLMTGNCYSDRAKELYPKQYSNIEIHPYNGENYFPFKKQSYSKKGDVKFTPLEKYLYMVNAPQHEKIIQYLRNEIETIKL